MIKKLRLATYKTLQKGKKWVSDKEKESSIKCKDGEIANIKTKVKSIPF